MLVCSSLEDGWHEQVRRETGSKAALSLACFLKPHAGFVSYLLGFGDFPVFLKNVQNMRSLLSAGRSTLFLHPATAGASRNWCI